VSRKFGEGRTMISPSSSSGERPDKPRPYGSSSIVVSAAPLIDDPWREWIAENVLIGVPPESIFATLESNGFAPEDAAHEINRALESPYLRGGELLRDRLKKREWILSVHRKLRRLHPQSAEIDRRHRLSRDEFLREYYAANRAVVITGMMDDWPAMRKWSLDYFAANVGDGIVEVQMGRSASPNYEIEREKHVTRIRFAEFIEMVRKAGATNDFYMTANNDSANRGALRPLWDDVVPVPEYLAPDPSGGFFWMGPAGTVTPFHHDLTNNLMAQVIGRKRLKIAPSWDLPIARNHYHCYSQLDGRVAPPAPAPALGEPQILECVLNPGELFFLPIGCLHYVEGLDITVTVSFTNFVFDNDFCSFYSTFGPV
jgi:Cupin-like domain